MTELKNKIDFALLVTVKNANPNGDPLGGNSPRQDSEGLGEISDVCIKRKIRNRLQDMGESIFVVSDDRCEDGFKCLKQRFDDKFNPTDTEKEKEKENKNKNKTKPAKVLDEEEVIETACASWIDVRTFGQVFAYDKGKGEKGISLSVRGPVTIRTAESADVVDANTMKITKSVNNVLNAGRKSSDTMGEKHRVKFGLYKIFGSINVSLAKKTNFSAEDAELIKEALRTLFVNDASSARPDGSMEVNKLYWWTHDCKNGKCSAAKVHNSLHIKKKAGVTTPHSFEDYDISVSKLEEVNLEVIEGF